MQLIPKNVANMVRIPKQIKYTANFLLEDEVSELLRIFKNTNIYMLVLLAVDIGLRRGEALALKWSNVDLDNRVINISENLVYTKDGTFYSSPKTENSKREIIVPETIIVELKELKKEQEKNKKILKSEYIDNDLVCCYSNGKNFNHGAF